MVGIHQGVTQSQQDLANLAIGVVPRRLLALGFKFFPQGYYIEYAAVYDTREDEEEPCNSSELELRVVH